VARRRASRQNTGSSSLSGSRCADANSALLVRVLSANHVLLTRKAPCLCVQSTIYALLPRTVPSLRAQSTIHDLLARKGNTGSSSISGSRCADANSALLVRVQSVSHALLTRTAPCWCVKATSHVLLTREVPSLQNHWILSLSGSRCADTNSALMVCVSHNQFKKVTPPTKSSTCCLFFLIKISS
jgi:hypothetical protein